MTTHITHPSVHMTSKAAVVGGVALVAAVTAGLVVGALDDPVLPVAPDNGVSQTVPDSGVRDSWQGRIGPAANGFRDSWMPPGTTDRDQGHVEQRR